MKALCVLKEMKAAGRTWAEMAERIQMEFGAQLDKDQSEGAGSVNSCFPCPPPGSGAGKNLRSRAARTARSGRVVTARPDLCSQVPHCHRFTLKKLGLRQWIE